MKLASRINAQEEVDVPPQCKVSVHKTGIEG